jgi:hypothetical protein
MAPFSSQQMLGLAPQRPAPQRPLSQDARITAAIARLSITRRAA